MMKVRNVITISLVTALLVACGGKGDTQMAQGTFEAEETLISAEATGVLKQFAVEEGQVLAEGQQVGAIDSLPLYLKKKQLEAQITAVLGRRPDVGVQLSALQEQLTTAERELKRVENLAQGDAATPKQLDDARSQVAVIKRQIAAQASSLNINSGSLSKEAVPLQVQIEQVADQLRKCRVVNPLAGTVLSKYAQPYEMVATGKPLYKIADLSTLTLRAYITGDQLPQVQIGQRVKVRTDNGAGGYNEAEGTISWVSAEAEFTPKTILTKEERQNKVYAVKVRVPNPEGKLKIGMYGETVF